MANLTSAEAKWVKDVQRVLNACPSNRIGFYTTGDSDVRMFDTDLVKGKDDQQDFYMIVHAADADLGYLVFPNLVHSTAG